MYLQVAIDGAECRMEQFRRRERQLVALTRCSRLPRAAAIQSLSRTPGAAKLLIEVVRNACAQCTRPRLIRRDQPLAGGFYKEHLFGIEKEICRAGGFRSCRA